TRCSGMLPLAFGRFILIGMLPVFAVFIVFFPFFRITQYFIGLIEFLKSFLSFFVIRIKVGMQSSGLFPISFSDVFLAGPSINSQNLIIINVFHKMIYAQF